MPNHDYICPDCGTRDEVFVRLRDDIPENTTCSRCGGDESRKVYDAEGTCRVNKLRSSWSDGYEIFQLPPNCPDRVVTSETQYQRTLAKYGMDYKTGVPETGRENECSAPAMQKKNPQTRLPGTRTKVRRKSKQKRL